MPFHEDVTSRPEIPMIVVHWLVISHTLDNTSSRLQLISAAPPYLPYLQYVHLDPSGWVLSGGSGRPGDTGTCPYRSAPLHPKPQPLCTGSIAAEAPSGAECAEVTMSSRCNNRDETEYSGFGIPRSCYNVAVNVLKWIGQDLKGWTRNTLDSVSKAWVDLRVLEIAPKRKDLGMMYTRNSTRDEYNEHLPPFN